MTTEQQQEQTIAQFIETHGITMTVERVPANPNMTDDPEWARTAAHHLCTLARPDDPNASATNRSLMRVYFSQGAAAFDKAHTLGHRKETGRGFMSPPRCAGLTCYKAWPCADILKSKDKNAQPKEPEIASVLDSLASDASSYENARDFADWASEYGYDEDSRKAERTYNAISEQARELRQFLGMAAYDALLFHTERE